jgi:hypothetical protein
MAVGHAHQDLIRPLTATTTRGSACRAEATRAVLAAPAAAPAALIVTAVAALTFGTILTSFAAISRRPELP